MTYNELIKEIQDQLATQGHVGYVTGIDAAGAISDLLKRADDATYYENQLIDLGYLRVAG